MWHLNGIFVVGTYGNGMGIKSCNLLFFGLVCKVMWGQYVDYTIIAVGHICAM